MMDMWSAVLRPLRGTGAVLIVVLALSSPAEAGIPASGFRDSLVVGELDAPTAIAFLPDRTLLIVEKGGALKLFDGTSTKTLATIPVCAGSEMGLLGVAVDPGFNQNGFIYLYRTKEGSAGCGTATGRFNQIVRVTLSGGGVNPGSLTELLSGIATDNGNHNGGVLRIGPDRALWVGVGDSGAGDNRGGPGSSTNPYAQNLASLNGKVLRLNLDGGVPLDNPFAGTAGVRGEIWAYGFRNPFRMSFDGMTGRLWIGDVGDRTVEEIDRGVAGGNYSWPRCEGDLQGPPNAPQACAAGSDIPPAFTYPRSGPTSLGACVIGGAFAGRALGAAAGEYVFGDCVSSGIFRLALNATRDGFTGAPQPLATNAGTPADFIEGPDGAIYYAAVSDGEVRRLAAASTEGDIPVTGATLTLRESLLSATRRFMAASSMDPAIDLGSGPKSADDPTLHGASLRVLSAGGGFDITYLLPARGWRYIGKPRVLGYQYTDAKLANGPVTSVTFRTGLLKLAGRGLGLVHSLGANPDPVSVVLQMGATRYCLSFGRSTGATTRFTAGKEFNARQALAPPACPA